MIQIISVFGSSFISDYYFTKSQTLNSPHTLFWPHYLLSPLVGFYIPTTFISLPQVFCSLQRTFILYTLKTSLLKLLRTQLKTLIINWIIHQFKIIKDITIIPFVSFHPDELFPNQMLPSKIFHLDKFCSRFSSTYGLPSLFHQTFDFHSDKDCSYSNIFAILTPSIFF